LLDVVEASPPRDTPERIIAVLPGSREQEVSEALPVFASVAEMFPDYRFIVCGVSSIDRSIYDRLISDHPVEIVMDKTHETLEQSRAALVTSGTATLEAALLNVPQVVCYKGGAVSYFIGRRLVKVDHIALVNLIMEKEVVKELIQKSFTEEQVEAALSKVLTPAQRAHVLGEYQRLHEKLGGPGASGRAAQVILQVVRQPQRPEVNILLRSEHP
jgi:lipid-A-disaccharide synthase